ncbi:hypothetical protein KRE40_03780 [Elizabethkingia meningoseptica]|uniref:hypothetical protein n=1 Tax=Elizabethkingia meningoseptica TaxID=238 RepID=UPI0023B17FF9|nr:hypothetical protein [Elizabethkingia meningoseptica]MDE5507771.1 hypothetical protein [Elizabethkingia meningoseptica]MDE5526626.1 hypothetical protein [Elizabethkingia meningoseptica]
MAVNSELIEIIKASQLPKIPNPTTGDLIHAQGDDLSTTSLQFFIDKINNGYNGTMATSTSVPNTGYYRYVVSSAGTYSNVSPSITVTDQELDENYVFISVKDGVSQKELSKKPNSKIQTWESRVFYKGSQVYYDGAIYEALVNTSPTDIPGYSPSWNLKTIGLTGDSLIFYPYDTYFPDFRDLRSIKEVFIKDYSSDYNYYIGTVRKNVNNQYFVKIIKTDATKPNYPDNYVSQIYFEETHAPSGRNVYALKENKNNIISDAGYIVIDWDIIREGFNFDFDPNSKYKLSKSISQLNANILIKSYLQDGNVYTKDEVNNNFATKLENNEKISTSVADGRYAFKNTDAYSKIQSDSKYALIGSLSSSGNKFVDAADYGFLPTKTASENRLALQNALNGGNKTLTVSVPGVYDLDATVFIDDNTHIIFGAGVILRKSAHYVFVLINRGASTRTYNENIIIDNLNIDYNGYDELITDPNSVYFGLRGFLTFWNIKRLRINNYTCKNYSSGQWALQIADFYDFVVDGVDISGHKDGIHLGRGKKFVIRNVKSKCYDDTIALNCFDYPQSNPTIGDIEDGLIEMIDDNYNNTWDNGSRFTLLLVGCPVAWRSGMSIRNGDAVTYSGKTFFALTGTTSGSDFTSTTPPTAEFESVQTTSEGITWRKVDDMAVQSATIKNVEYKNIRHNFPVIGWLAWFMLEEDGKYTRTNHPELPANKMPYVQNVTFENITSPLGVIKFQDKYKYSVNFKNINGRKGGSTLIIGENNIGSRALIDNCELRDNDNHWLGTGVDYIIRDCNTIGTPNISINGRLRTNISVNHGDLSQLTPNKGDEIIINGVKKIWSGINWKDLN